MGMVFEGFIVFVVLAFAVREVIITRRLLAQHKTAESKQDQAVDGDDAVAARTSSHQD